MNFNDYTIDESDYEFFSSLPKDEKLLFVYDLICVGYYGTGSSEEPEIDNKKVPVDDSIFLEYDPDLENIVSSSINEKADVNILILNDKLILNSNSEQLLNDAIKDMILDGMILLSFNLDESAMRNFHALDYCKIFTIVGKEFKICKN